MGGDRKGAGAGGRCAAGGTIGYFFSVVVRAFKGHGSRGEGETGNWKRGMQLEVKGRFLNVLVMNRSERWNLDVAGSAYGGRDFGPCSYPRGWTLNKLIIIIIITLSFHDLVFHALWQ